MIPAVRAIAPGAWLIAACLGTAGCANRTVDTADGGAVPDRPIAEVMSDHRDTLMGIEGVTGIGEGLCDEQPCIRVFVVRRTPEIEEEIPDRLEGYVVDVVETGRIDARPPG